MKILVVSYLFGSQAEGICTKRIVDALHMAGVELEVLTSWDADCGHTEYKVNKIEIANWMLKPLRCLNPLARYLGLDRASYFVWCIKALFFKVDNRTNVIYGRSSPIVSLLVASYLGRKSRIRKIWVHFSDPVPSPFDDMYSTRSRLKKYFSTAVLRSVEGATYTSTQAANYHLSLLKTFRKIRIVDLPHVKPSKHLDQNSQNENREYFLYVGSVYQERSPFKMLCAFSEYRKRGGRCDLVFLGGGGSYLNNQIDRASEYKGFDFENSIRVEPYSTDIDAWIRPAQALLVFDSFVGDPVFLTTKFVEYMAYRKPVLLISPKGSPASDYAMGDPTVICVNSDSEDAITQGFDSASRIFLDDSCWVRRQVASSIYNPEVLAKKLISAI